jgi:hypothetical protein
MSRSGYYEENDGEGTYGLWRGAVTRAISGARGQAFLREMASALDEMPVKELYAEVLVADSEHVCALGSVARARRMDVSTVDECDGEEVGQAFGIARAMACEIAYQNDECSGYCETPAQRWWRMRAWVDANLKKGS